MDREALYAYFDQHYLTKRDMLPRMPLGLDPESFWQDVLSRRKAKGTTLPIRGPRGASYWYVTTDHMISASETIVNELIQGEPSQAALAPLEEVFYTSYVEGSQLSMQAAMEFLQGDAGPRDIEEQMIANNRHALSFAGSNMYHPVDADFIRMLSYILTQNMEGGGKEYRTSDRIDIPFMMGEPYEVPTALSIPECVKEITGFLAEPSVHPLIKAAVAHAWVLAVRPFNEGNERLARLLSTLILYRAGYTFFGEVSISSLIARDGYPYYTAAANILRAENEGDLTYFIECYLLLLDRAVEERRNKRETKIRENLAAEAALAKTPLAAEDEGLPEKNVTEDDITESLMADGFVSLMDLGKSQPPERNEILWAGEHAVRSVLEGIDDGSSTLIARFARLLLDKLNAGQYEIVSPEIEHALDLSYSQVKGLIFSMREKGVIEATGRNEKVMRYTFSTGGVELAETDYSETLINTVDAMATGQSMKDKRIGAAIQNGLSSGIVMKQEYEKNSDTAKWDDDMKLAEQMGLVRGISKDRCHILRDVRPRFDRLRPGQKKRARLMYDSFGEEIFSLDMVVATLDYSSSTASAYLHQFTLLQILDCRKEDVNKYQFLVNPQEHPEVFDVVA